ncbi:MAG: ATP-binding cassette domain-containing protein, partial [Acetobacteraceae bacterium]
LQGAKPEGRRLQEAGGNLSGGQRQRLALARAYLQDAAVLVLDEPTDGLDPNQKHEVRTLIRRMAPAKAIVISTHLLDEVEAICTRAILIAGGRVIADETPAELARRHPSGRLEEVFRALTTEPVAEAA